MTRRDYLGSFELMVLLAVMQLDDDAYGVPLARTIEDTTGRPVALGSVYAALDRLQERGYLTSTLGDPTPERGGRAKRYFRVSAKGAQAASESRRAFTTLWQDLPAPDSNPA